MSTENAALTDFVTETATDSDTTPAEDERPSWTPHSNTQSGDVCQNCGAPVDTQTARVWGDNNDVLHHCTDCVTATAMKKGAGAVKDYDRRATDSGHLGGGF